MKILTIEKMTPRSLLLFENSLKSEATLKHYRYYLDQFLKFHNIGSCEMLISKSAKDLQAMVEDYIIHLKDKVSPNTIPTMYYPLQTFLEVNDIELRWKKIRRLFPSKIKAGGNAYATKDIQKMLDYTAILRNKAIIHFLASTGVRIGAIPNLKIKHLEKMPHSCKSVLVYEGDIEEYYTFLTPEASKVLDEYIEKRKNDLEKITPDSPIFREDYKIGIEKVKPLSKKGIELVLKRIADNIKIRKPVKKNRYSVPLVHGFRKRLNTILKLNSSINPAIVEKLLGHKIGLEQAYLRPTKEQLFAEFKKGIDDLTISEEHKLKSKNIFLEKEISTLQQEKKNNEFLKEKFSNLELKYERLASDHVKFQKSVINILKNEKRIIQILP